MMSYDYKKAHKGGEPFKISRKDHNRLLPNRKLDFRQRAEYYKWDDRIVINYLMKNWAKLLITLLYPVIVLLHGIVNYKDVNVELKGLWYQKTLGKFVSNTVYARHQLYDELMQARIS